MDPKPLEFITPIHPATDLPCTPDVGSEADHDEPDARGVRAHSTQSKPEPVNVNDPDAKIVTGQEAPVPVVDEDPEWDERNGE